MRVLILANGEPPTQILLAQLAAEHDLFVATDGAGLTAARLGSAPDIVSGDFDSLDLEAAQAALPNTEFIPTPDQNRTDLQKAMQIAQDRGAGSLTIVGAVGRRIDHTLGNIGLLLRWRLDFPALPVAFVADGSETRALSGETILETELGDVISLLSLDGQARVTIGGVRWPLANHVLPVGVEGLLNEATAARVTLRAEGGVVIVCHLRAWMRSHL